MMLKKIRHEFAKLLRLILLPAVLIAICGQEISYAKEEAKKEELELGLIPDFAQKPIAKPQSVKAEGIKAGVLEVKEEAKKVSAGKVTTVEAPPKEISAEAPSRQAREEKVEEAVSKYKATEKIKTAPITSTPVTLSEQPIAPTPPKPEAQAPKSALSDLLNEADVLFAGGRYEEAITKWEKALELDPSNTDIKRNINEAEARIEMRFAKETKAAKPEIISPSRKEVGIEKMSIAEKPSVLKMTSEKIKQKFTLKDCIDTAVKNHIPLQVAEKSVKLARLRVLEARRNMLPSASVNFETSSGKVNGQRYTGRKQYIEGQQPVFHGGELYYAMKQAEVNLEITRTEYSKIKNELVLQVKKGYYTLAKSKENLELQKELSNSVERIYDMVKKQAEANIISKIELLNVTSQKSQVGYQLASAQGDVEVAELILKQAMNVDPKADIDIETDLALNKVEVDYEKALSAAMANRPEVRINLLMMDYYRYGQRIARAKGSFKVDIMGNWGLAKEEYAYPDNGIIPGSPQNPDGSYTNWYQDNKLEQQWYAGIKASVPVWGSTAEYSYTREQWVPVVSAYQGTEAATNAFKFKLFDRLDTFSEVQLSDIDFERARQELVKIRQDVTLEVKEQCFNYQKALIQLETASSKVKYQESDLNFMKMKRGLDEVQDSNVIDSMIKLAQEKFGYVQALTDCHISLASINKAIGIENYYKERPE
ncbi:MAG: TolC family protein [Candidatus Omnitrophica bacterium]|nr:TolC family protein [Candidatus Omnitrophota bacterium]MCM8791461.1 TolC family protein [Candidatus Omnitrophota bacterium]